MVKICQNCEDPTYCHSIIQRCELESEVVITEEDQELYDAFLDDLAEKKQEIEEIRREMDEHREDD